MITHDLDTLLARCSRVAVLVDRKIVVDTLAGIMNNPHPWIQEYFHGPRARAAQNAARQGNLSMEREANYVAVGAFIVLVVAMAVIFVLWYTNARDRREYELYEIYFTGSVSGLDRGSPVRYLGVDVGRVRRLSIDRNNASRVAVEVEIDESAPISSATRASLGLQGVTGLLFINLKEALGSRIARSRSNRAGAIR